MPPVSPPRSEYGKRLDRVIENLEADEILKSYFGWEEIPSGGNDWPSRKRIFKDDDGSVSAKLSPKLAITQVCEMSSFSVLGNGGYTDSDLIGTLAFTVSTHVPDKIGIDETEESRSEIEKQLCSDLIHAVIDRVRAKCDDSDNLWQDVAMDTPVTYTSTKGVRRAFAYVDFSGQADTTSDYAS